MDKKSKKEIHRANIKVFNDRTMPLYIADTNAFGTANMGITVANASAAGKMFIAYINDATIGAGNYAAIYLENSSSSARTAQISCLSGFVKTQIEMDIFFNVSSFSGTSFTPRNTNATSSISSVLSVKTSVNQSSPPFSGGTCIIQCAHDMAFVQEANGIFTIPPGSNCVVLFQNSATGSASNCHFIVTWWEY